MSYVVTESCIRCKYMDCVSTCPVNCFREGENMLVIDQLTCIDCAACETACPVDAIVSDAVAGTATWVELNRKYAAVWPVILERGEAPHDADAYREVADKLALLNQAPAARA
ncbi:MAG TPA: ferredoxin family protein [Candidatus Baltobacteraceae bacterium]|jgi:ferredoxin